MKNKWFISALGLLLVIGIGGVGLMLLRVSSLPSAMHHVTAQAQPAPIAPAQNSAAQVAGNYSGVVKLQFTLVGVYSDTLAAPQPPAAGTPAPPDLGSIDLSLPLSQTGNTLNGYVSLDKTLIFTVEHTIQNGGANLHIGPYVNGSFDGINLTLISERIATTLNRKPVQRQFRLTGAVSQSDGSQLTGEYRETLWGVARQPVTVLGTFTLQRPVFDKIAPDTSNKAPETVADTAVTAQGTGVTINVLTNDTDTNGDVLTITSVSKPQFGTATIDGQTVSYTPNANFVGNDSFSYFISDGKGGTAAGSVTIIVNGNNGPNQSPTAADDAATTAPGSAVIIDVLVNDGDPNGDALLITIDGPPNNGKASVENGKIVYTPNAGFVGTDSFTYIVSDGKGGTATAKVTVQVTAGNAFSLYLPVIRR